MALLSGPTRAVSSSPDARVAVHSGAEDADAELDGRTSPARRTIIAVAEEMNLRFVFEVFTILLSDCKRTALGIVPRAFITLKS